MNNVNWKIIFTILLIASFIIPVSASPEYVNSTNLTAWYRFDENTGTVLIDSSVNKYNSSSITNFAWTDGKYKKAGSFNGATSYAIIPYTSLACNGSMSLLTNFNTTNLTKTEQAIIGQTGSMVGRNYQAYIEYNKFKFLVANGTAQSTATFTTSVSANKTYFVAFTVSGNSVKMYLYDGINWFNETKTTTVLLKQNSTGEYKIGGMSTAYHNTMWHGWIDNLIIFNRVLTTSEISTMSNNSMYVGSTADALNLTKPILASAGIMTVINPYDYTKIFLLITITFNKLFQLVITMFGWLTRGDDNG